MIEEHVAEPLPDAIKATDRPLSFVQTMGAVAWSFLGIRRSADHANDVKKLNPVHVVVAGVLGAALFVVALVTIVQWVISSGAAR